MGGIMVPITMSTGIQRAREDNRADERFDMDKQLHERRLEGLDLGMQRDRLALGEAQKDAPLKDLERKAKTTSEMAKQAYVLLNSGHPELGEIPDDQVGPFMAKFLTDTPVFGEAKLMPDGTVSDGEHAIQMDRQTALKMLAGLADPAKAMELAQKEQQYINEKGKVETMTAGEAKSRGLEAATDKMAGYTLNKARIEDQFAEETAGLNVGKLRSEISKNYASAQKDRAEGAGGYKFSPQNAGAVESDAYDSYLADLGYQFTVVSDGITSSKQWTKGGKAAEISPEDHAAARDFAALTSGILATGQAQTVPHARMLAMRHMPPASPRTETVTGADGKEYVQARQGEPGARQSKDGSWWKEAGSGSRGLEFLKPPGLMERMLGNANVSGVMPEVQFDGSGRPAGVTTRAESLQAENLANRLLQSGEAATLPEARELAAQKIEQFNALNQTFAEQTGKTADQDPEGFKAFVQQALGQGEQGQNKAATAGRGTPPKAYPGARWAKNPKTGSYGWFVKRNGKYFQVVEK